MTPYPYETATPEQRAIGAWWWCVHHEIHCEPLTEPVENRVKYVRENKASHEIATRLRELAPVLHPERLPALLVEARRACDEALRAYEPELMALHREEYPDTQWNGRSIFAERGES